MSEINPYHENRPWGKEEWFKTTEPVDMVKILTINPGEETSLQFHDKRSEFWKVLSGNGEVQIGEEILKAEGEQEFFVPVKLKHRLKGGTEPLVLLELSLGHFDESDITRLADKYNRHK